MVLLKRVPPPKKRKHHKATGGFAKLWTNFSPSAIQASQAASRREIDEHAIFVCFSMFSFWKKVVKWCESAWRSERLENVENFAGVFANPWKCAKSCLNMFNNGLKTIAQVKSKSGNKAGFASSDFGNTSGWPVSSSKSSRRRRKSYSWRSCCRMPRSSLSRDVLLVHHLSVFRVGDLWTNKRSCAKIELVYWSQGPKSMFPFHEIAILLVLKLPPKDSCKKQKKHETNWKNMKNNR